MGVKFTDGQVKALIAKIDPKTLRSAIQKAALYVIGHAMENGSSGLADSLLERVESAPYLKKSAGKVIQFITKHGPFVHSPDTGFVFSRSKRDALNKQEGGFDFDALVEDAPLWDDAPQAKKEAKAFDVFKELESFVKRAQGKVEAGQCVEAALIPYLEALLGQYAGRKAIASAQAATPAERAEIVKAAASPAPAPAESLSFPAIEVEEAVEA